MDRLTMKIDANPKYGFTGRESHDLTQKLYEVVALRDFGVIKKGDIGGWIGSEDNLSHDGNCWLGPDCYAMGNSLISGNAIISGTDIWFYDSALVIENAILSGTNIRLWGHSMVRGDAILSGTNIWLWDNSQINGNAIIAAEKISLRGNVKLSGQQVVSGKDIKLNATPPANDNLIRPARLLIRHASHGINL